MAELRYSDIVPPSGGPVVDPADLCAVVRDALVFGPDESGDDEGIGNALRGLLNDLADVGIQPVLVGGLAMLQHVPGRNTRDIDFIVHPGDVANIRGFQEEERNEWFAMGRVGPLKVDLLFTSNPLFDLVARGYCAHGRFHGVTLKVANPVGLVLLKLFALPSLYRQGDISRAKLYESDIRSLCLTHPVDDAGVLDILAQHMIGSDINSLREIMAEIREDLRKNPFQQPNQQT